MHIDGLYLCNRALESEFPWFSNTHAGLRLADIEAVPEGMGADFAFALPFVVAAAAKRVGKTGLECDPRQVAQRLVELMQESHYFSFAISERGHINVSATDAWFKEFIARLSAAEPATLLDCSWLSISEDNLSNLLVRAWSMSETTAFKEVAEKYAELLPQVGLAHVDSAHTIEPILMLIYMSAAPEVDPKAFRCGYHSQENLPWLYSHFSRCWREVATVDGIAFDWQQVTMGAARQPLRAWQEDIFQVELLRWLAVSRSVFLVEQELARLPYFRKSILHLVGGLRLFFAFYNHPSNRESASGTTRVLLQVFGRELELAWQRIFS